MSTKEEGSTGAADSTEQTSAKPKTREEISALAGKLLPKYVAADQEVTKIRKQLEASLQSRSNIVKQINDEVGKGPFTYKGEYLGKICTRGNTWFFRGKNPDETISID